MAEPARAFANAQEREWQRKLAKKTPLLTLAAQNKEGEYQKSPPRGSLSSVSSPQEPSFDRQTAPQNSNGAAGKSPTKTQTSNNEKLDPAFMFVWKGIMRVLTHTFALTISTVIFPLILLPIIVGLYTLRFVGVNFLNAGKPWKLPLGIIDFPIAPLAFDEYIEAMLWCTAGCFIILFLLVFIITVMMVIKNFCGGIESICTLIPEVHALFS